MTGCVVGSPDICCSGICSSSLGHLCLHCGCHDLLHHCCYGCSFLGLFQRRLYHSHHCGLLNHIRHCLSSLSFDGCASLCFRVCHCRICSCSLVCFSCSCLRLWWQLSLCVVGYPLACIHQNCLFIWLGNLLSRPLDTSQRLSSCFHSPARSPILASIWYT